ARSFARADQAAHHAFGGEQIGVRGGERQALAEDLASGGRRGRHRHQSSGRTTTRRDGSTPSDSLITPGRALITSCTHLRSNADIGSRRTGSPYSFTFSAAFLATAASSLRRVAR